MRYALILIIALLAGCATVSVSRKAAEPGDNKLEIEYRGTPIGAARLLKASDDVPREALEVAEQAVENGQPVSVSTDNVDLSAGYHGYGYGGYGYGDAYAANTVVGGQGGYYVAQTGGGSSLPVLGATGYTVGTTSTSETFDPAVKCPDDSDAPRTFMQELACQRASNIWQNARLRELSE